MSVEEEQKYLDVITSETEKKKNFANVRDVEIKDGKEKEKRSSAPPQSADDIEKRNLEFKIECEREAAEKKALLQAVISESAAAGNPLPPSLIKLLHHSNRKLFFFLFFFFNEKHIFFSCSFVGRTKRTSKTCQ